LFAPSSHSCHSLCFVQNNSRTLSDVIKGVVDNFEPLMWVFYLFICTVVIYAQFGLTFFEDWFVYDGENDDSPGCHSVVSCILLIFYHAVPAGDIGEVLDNISNRKNNYMERLVFEISFFIWVGVLLFNIITGLMVDGFGSLREEDKERRDILENYCFVCGLSRSFYDDMPNFKGPSFDWHKDNDHAYWTYVYFYVYLKRKDQNDYSGVESYVWKQIEEERYEWIPARMSSSIQVHQTFKIRDKDPGGDDGGINLDQPM